MIRNSDGTPYRLNADINQYNPSAPEHDLFNIWDEDAIRRGGSPVYYYDILLQPQTTDHFYKEDRGKLFSPTYTELYCTYEVQASQNYVNQFGTDCTNTVILEFNYRAVLRALGRPPKVGAKIYTPHLKEYWKVLQRNAGEFKMWGILRLQLLCQKWQNDAVTGGFTGNVPDTPSGLDII